MFNYLFADAHVNIHVEVMRRQMRFARLPSSMLLTLRRRPTTVRCSEGVSTNVFKNYEIFAFWFVVYPKFDCVVNTKRSRRTSRENSDAVEDGRVFWVSRFTMLSRFCDRRGSITNRERLLFWRWEVGRRRYGIPEHCWPWWTTIDGLAPMKDMKNSICRFCKEVSCFKVVVILRFLTLRSSLIVKRSTIKAWIDAHIDFMLTCFMSCTFHVSQDSWTHSTYCKDRNFIR